MNREPILFFEDVVLFEDELHDHGISILSVKVADTSYLLREFVTKERYIKDIPLSLSELSDPAAVFPHLHVVKEESEKLLLPPDVNSEVKGDIVRNMT
uniref:TIP41-like protein n=1 Tax=Eptatretus burgeri TaxID=7764 RepID=A0A8C4NBF1_EPTBU